MVIMNESITWTKEQLDELQAALAEEPLLAPWYIKMVSARDDTERSEVAQEMNNIVQRITDALSEAATLWIKMMEETAHA